MRSFIKISGMVFNLQSVHKYMVDMAIFNVQKNKKKKKKVGKPELWFMCSAHSLIVLYICVKFCENISNGFQHTEPTWLHGRNGYAQCSKGNNTKSKQTRVRIHVFCTLSHSALHLCEVWWNISDGIRFMEQTRMMAALMERRRTLKISDGIT